MKLISIADLLAEVTNQFPGRYVTVDDRPIIMRRLTDVLAKALSADFGLGNMPPVEVLLDRFSYNEETGILSSKTRNMPIGQKYKAGYLRISLDHQGRRYRLTVHRVAWAMFYKKIPSADFVIHHVDGNKANNRISNLMTITHSSNVSKHWKIRRQNAQSPGHF